MLGPVFLRILSGNPQHSQWFDNEWFRVVPCNYVISSFHCNSFFACTLNSSPRARNGGARAAQGRTILLPKQREDVGVRTQRVEQIRPLHSIFRFFYPNWSQSLSDGNCCVGYATFECPARPLWHFAVRIPLRLLSIPCHSKEQFPMVRTHCEV